MDDITKQTLLGFLGSALGALVAGYLGVVFGFRQMRKQKAFDQQLEWYNEMIKTINIIVSNTNILALMDGETQQGTEAFSEMPNVTFKLNQLASDAELYATPRAYKAIRQMWQDLNSLAPKMKGQRINSDPGFEESTRAAIESTILLKKVKSILVADLRKHLGLKQIFE